MSMSTQTTVALIIAHPGVFHADDVCAVAWLRLTGVAAPVVRRVPTPAEMADPAVMVIDIGGQHDAALANFDHHQRGGAGARWDTEVPYAAFGLVYDTCRPADPAVDQRLLEVVVLPVDAADCGWGTQEGTRPMLPFSRVISGFNPGAGASQAERDTAFERAVAWAGVVLGNELRSAEEWAAARSEVLAAGTADAGRVLILEKFAPWASHIFDRPDQERLLYVVHPSERGGWQIQQVPVQPGSFEGRKPLPKEWAGLRDVELADVTGVPDAVFCHPGRFCGGAASRMGTLDLAARAVEA